MCVSVSQSVTIIHAALDLTVQAPWPQSNPGLVPPPDIDLTGQDPPPPTGHGTSLDRDPTWPWPWPWPSPIPSGQGNSLDREPSASDIRWSSLETCSNLFTLGPLQPVLVAIEACMISTSGWYTSYWNAFLFLHLSVHFN